MALFNYSIEIQGSLEEDYKKDIESKMQKPIRAGLKALDSDMRYMLENYIQADVYGVYHPDSYIRRADSPEYGTSISDMDKTVLSELISYNILRFSYQPVGFHSLYDGEDEYYNDGDELIKVLETGKGYPWGVDEYVNSNGETLGARPFWTPFTTELFEGGQAEFSFIKGFNANNNGVGTLTFDDSTELSSSDDYTFEF